MEAHAVMAWLVVVQVRPWVVAVAPQWNPRQRVRTSHESCGESQRAVWTVVPDIVFLESSKRN